MRLLNLFGAIGLDSTLKDIRIMLAAIARPLTQVTGAGSNRLSVDVNAVTGTVAAVTTVGTITNAVPVGTVANQTNMGGVAAFELQKAMSHLTFAQTIRARL